MGRLLIGVFLGLLAWLWWQSRRRSDIAQQASRQADSAQPPIQPAEPQAVVACTHCGLHVPAADAVLDRQGLPHCSAAHAHAHEAGGA